MNAIKKMFRAWLLPAIMALATSTAIADGKEYVLDVSADGATATLNLDVHTSYLSTTAIWWSRFSYAVTVPWITDVQVLGYHHSDVLNSSGTDFSYWLQWDSLMNGNASDVWERGGNPIKVTATCVKNTGGARSFRAKLNERMDYLTVRQAGSSVTVSSISISGESSVASGGTATYTCTATLSDSSTTSVTPTWSISSGSSYASIASSGKLSANTVSSSQNVTIKAEYGGKSAVKTVSITASTTTGTPIFTLSADAGRTELTKVDLNGSNSAIIPSSVKRIWPYAFYHKEDLQYIQFPDGLCRISESTFEGCSNLQSFDLPPTVTNIDTRAFHSCVSIEGLTIPGSLTEVSDYAFSFCSGLTNLTIEAGVKSIHSCAFKGSSITHIVIPRSVETIWGDAFGSSPNLRYAYLPKSIANWIYISLLNPGGPFDSCHSKFKVVYYKDSLIALDAMGGTVDGFYVPCEYGATLGTLPTPVKDGYVFDGWYSDSSYSNAITAKTIGSSSLSTLYAKWSKQTVTISFNTNGGSSCSDETYAVGGTYGILPTPTKIGSVFSGWYSNSSLTTAVTENSIVNSSVTTLYAKWAAQTVSISFNSNGGTSCSAQTYTIGSTYGTLPTPTKTNYDFAGWYSDSSLSTRIYASSTVSASVTTLYAKWTAQAVSVTFNSNGGTSCSAQTYTVGSTYGTLPTPTKDRCNFAGWYSDSALTKQVSSSSTVATSVTTLYAKWTEKNYVSVSFETNGGSECDATEYEVGVAYGTLPVPSKSNSTFDGWYADASLTEEVTVSSIASADVTILYAKWREAFLIRNVEARQRFPWNGKVDVSFDVTGEIPLADWQENPHLVITAKDASTGDTLATSESEFLSGDTTADARHHTVVWNMEDQGLSFKSTGVIFSVTYQADTNLYCVIDLSGGTDAASYPVSYLSDVPDGGWTDEYKTEKLVMRLIMPGTFIMGSPEDELGRQRDETQHEVTISKPFYMGIFEVTQKQYQLATGNNPSYYLGDMRPVERVHSSSRACFSGIRSDQMPSFIDLLRAKTSMPFNLPSEAQWEYACRAGTVTALNNGKNLESVSSDSAMTYIGRYAYNQSDGEGGCTSKHTTVGSYLPNDWGLYDMHGNVAEWCIDGYGAYVADAITDPIGYTTDSYSVVRGGAWQNEARSCRSASRSYLHSVLAFGFIGLRIYSSTEEAKVSPGYSYAISINFTPPALIESLQGVYDAAWAGGNEVSISDNGVEVLRTTGAGEFALDAGGVCRHELTLTTLADGEVQEVCHATVYVGMRYEEVAGAAVLTEILPSASGTAIIPAKVDNLDVVRVEDGVLDGFSLAYVSGNPAVAISATLQQVYVTDAYTGEMAENMTKGLSLSMPGENILAKSTKLSASCAVEGAVMRYTTDGTMPTEESPVFKAFTVKSAMTVTVGAFLDGERVLTMQGTYWFGEVETPEIAVEGNLTFTGNQKRRVALSCATEGATIRYTLHGEEPTEDSPAYTEPFVVSLAPDEQITIRARAFKADCKPSEIVEKTVSREWTLGDGAGCPDLAFATGGGADWVRDASGGPDGGECLRSGAVGDEEESWLETVVTGAGKVSFRWRTSCEETDDEESPWDRVEFSVDGTLIAWLDGVRDWQSVEYTVKGAGDHTLRWSYIKDVSDSDGEDCAWLAEVSWQAGGAKPIVENDDGALVTGDEENGFVIKPSEGAKAVVLTIPDGVDAAKVTVVVGTEVEMVTANGAEVRVGAHGSDITEWLDIPTSGNDALVASATVKESVAKETLDVEKGAVINLDPADPSLTTTETKPGLTYTLREGVSLKAMSDGDSKVGDGKPWTPAITVKGGDSGFYTIKVTK